jgi:hypothetical protein
VGRFSVVGLDVLLADAGVVDVVPEHADRAR